MTASDDANDRLTEIANEFGRVRNLLAKRVTAGNSPCAARRALYSLRRGEYDRALGYCDTAIARDAEWGRFVALVRAEVQRTRAEAVAAVARLRG